MSAFLGPIHFWLYNKIKLQEEFIQEIFETSEKLNWDTNLQEKTDTACGKADLRPLEEVIDVNNIHGWLQQKIGVSEERLAFAVTTLLKEDNSRISMLKQTAFDFGVTHPIEKDADVNIAFKFLNDSLLDGMPCDHVNQLVEQNEEQITWLHTNCVHHGFWEQVNGDISVYYELRREIIKGMLLESGLQYHERENGVNEIKKG